MNNCQATAYAFRLDAIEHRYLYYRTVSLWAGSIEKHGRDSRKPSPVNINSFEQIINALGESFIWVRNNKDKTRWIEQYGWMLTPVSFAETSLVYLLKSCICVKSPFGLFWDVNIRRNRATSRRTGHIREEILKRDGQKCLLCRKTEQDGVKQTMDHVIPFSRGGETSTNNIVTLCEQCNQGLKNQNHPNLFALANLHHGWDPQLINTTATPDVIAYTAMISQNIMVSRACFNDNFS